MTRDEALDNLRHLFHKTRLTSNVSVPADIVHALVYGECSKEKALRLAVCDQVDLLNGCRKLANDAPTQELATIRHIRADRIEERLNITKAALS